MRERCGGDWAVVLLKSGDAAAELEIDFGPGWWFRKADDCAGRDNWDERQVGTTTQVFRNRLDAHDVAHLRLTPLKQ